VLVPDASSGAVTTATGAFSVDVLAPGKHRILVRRLGYGPLDTTLVFGEKGMRDQRVVLTRIASLDSVIVTATRVDQPMREFEENRKLGLGHFFTREQLQKVEEQKLTTILSQTAGAGIITMGPHGFVVGMHRGPPMCLPDKLDCFRNNGFYVGDDAPIACYAQVYLDDTLLNFGSPTPPVDINPFLPDQIESIEFYSGAGQTPGRYSSLNSQCGVLVIHTRRTP
jgi:hypothetical protein